MTNREMRFVGAGNSAVVFTGAQDRAVYRIRKNCKDIEDYEVAYSFDQRLKERLMISIFTEEFLPKTEITSLSPEEVRTIAEHLEGIGEQQFSKRLKSWISAESTLKVSCQSNCCLLPEEIDTFCDEQSATLCVELKPKCGTFPRRPYFVGRANETDAARLQPPMCRFCALQFYPRKSGRWCIPSRYCPVQLFSGDKGVMKAALSALLSTPQNNLGLFVNGHRVLHSAEVNCKPTTTFAACGVALPSNAVQPAPLFISSTIESWRKHLTTFFGLTNPDDDRAYSALLELLAASLLQPVDSNHQLPVKIERSAELRCCKSVKLPPKCVLERLLRAQAFELRVGDAVELQRLVESSGSKFSDTDLWTEFLSDDSDDEVSSCFIERLFTSPIWLGLGDTECNDNYDHVGHVTEPHTLSLADRIRGYLLAALAKDVSLMIAMRRLKPDADVAVVRRCATALKRAIFVVELDLPATAHLPLRFVVIVTIIDTALKPVEKIKHHAHEDLDLQRCLEEIADDYISRTGEVGNY